MVDTIAGIWAITRDAIYVRQLMYQSDTYRDWERAEITMSFASKRETSWYMVIITATLYLLCMLVALVCSPVPVIGRLVGWTCAFFKIILLLVGGSLIGLIIISYPIEMASDMLYQL